ncbi:MAG: hypothetical protein AB1403_07090 [Candidatus Riflebacteria bacterium]
MAKTTDKRTSNLIIAGGYCLVAIIILFNYLGQTSRARLAVSIPEGVTAAQSSDIQNLRKQLEEEKKVNSEMRNILRQIQQNGVVSSEISPAVAYRGSIEDLSKSLPDLKTELLENAVTPRPNPFNPVKNPYAPIRKKEDPVKVVTTNSGFPFARSLKCDPHLSFFISGANSESEFHGN